MWIWVCACWRVGGRESVRLGTVNGCKRLLQITFGIHCTIKQGHAATGWLAKATQPLPFLAPLRLQSLSRSTIPVSELKLVPGSAWAMPMPMPMPLLLLLLQPSRRYGFITGAHDPAVQRSITSAMVSSGSWIASVIRRPACVLCKTEAVLALLDDSDVRRENSARVCSLIGQPLARDFLRPLACGRINTIICRLKPSTYVE